MTGRLEGRKGLGVKYLNEMKFVEVSACEDLAKISSQYTRN